LAKHRPNKKKAPKEPNSDDSEKKDLPPSEPLATDAEKENTNRQLKKLYWIRVALAVIAGAAATFMFEPFEGEERRWISIGFMITIFILSIGFAKGMNMRLPRSDRKKIVTEAIGSYVFLYLFIWILTYTIVNSLGSESGLTSPFS
jgi:hypothetical protein